MIKVLPKGEPSSFHLSSFLVSITLYSTGWNSSLSRFGVALSNPGGLDRVHPLRKPPPEPYLHSFLATYLIPVTLPLLDESKGGPIVSDPANSRDLTGSMETDTLKADPGMIGDGLVLLGVAAGKYLSHRQGYEETRLSPTECPSPMIDLVV